MYAKCLEQSLEYSQYETSVAGCALEPPGGVKNYMCIEDTPSNEMKACEVIALFRASGQVTDRVEKEF